MSVKIIHGDCLVELPRLRDEGFLAHAVVTDPPYHLNSIVKRFDKDNAASAKHGTDGAFARSSRGFMGKTWDGGDVAFRPETWRAVYDCLLPGAHLLAFGGTRGAHRLACAIEDAGFEIRDSICWIYGSGFSKSHDISKAIDKAGPSALAPFNEFATHYENQRKASGMTHAGICAAGSWFGIVNHGGASVNWANGYAMPTPAQFDILEPLLKLDPLWRDFVRVEYERQIIGERKVHRGVAFTSDGPNVLPITTPCSAAAQQWQGWGTALKPAHEPIIVARKPFKGSVAANVQRYGCGGLNINESLVEAAFGESLPRLPANVIHDGSDEVLAAFPDAPGQLRDVTGKEQSHVTKNCYGKYARGGSGATARGDAGSAARFFYTAKADAADRAGSNHPTVKPTDLMRYLIRLITPPGGTVLDPFAGTGSTGLAADQLGFNAVLIEQDATYAEDARRKVRGDAPLLADVS